jgi:ribosomal protein S18 acetylase RimI-like enzyme
MPGPIIIRTPQSKQEWDTVRQMLLDYRSEFDDQTCFTSFEAEMDHIEQLYAEKDKIKLIAVDTESNALAGCVALRPFSKRIAEMKRLYVVPAYRGYKLGRQLAEAIIKTATTQGYHSMILDTMHEMKSAQQLYQHLGFRVIPPYNHQDLSKVVCYEKILRHD